MSYRKITVNDRQYQYVIGKVNTKIVGIGVFKNSEIGEVVEIPEYCECCGEPMTELYSSHVNRRHLSVTPKHIAMVISAR